MTMYKIYLNNISIDIASDCAFIISVRDVEKNIVEVNALIRLFTNALLDDRPLWLREFIPSYNTLLVEFDLLSADHLMVNDYLKRLVAKTLSASFVNQENRENGHTSAKSIKRNSYRVPVCYQLPDRESDMHLVSQAKNMSIDEIIKLHCDTSYQVYATGFLPGFAYMGELPAALSQARLSQPRLKVPAGAVAIADQQTAIYPCESPGGWHILGYTPVSLFKHENSEEPLLQTGDTVEFYPISASEYENWKPSWK